MIKTKSLRHKSQKKKNYSSGALQVKPTNKSMILTIMDGEHLARVIGM